MEYRPYISVIIPTYNRATMLVQTIDSFLNQSYAEDQYEIIVSDNNSTDSTPEVVRKYIQNHPGRITYLKEPRQGVHFARNTAAKVSKGDILYFTDDDMIADRDLLQEMIKVFSFDSRVGTATGRVLPEWEIEPPTWIPKLCYNGLLSLNDPPADFIISTRDCNVFSCHQAIRRDVFFKSGGFNPENTAGEWIGDGETGLNIKIKELGYKFGYNGASIIYHVIPASRMTQTYLNKRLANQGNCDSYTEYRKYLHTRLQLIRKIIGYIYKLARVGIRYLVDFSLQKMRWRLDRARVSYYLNRIRYDWRLINDAQWRELVLKTDWLEE